MAVPVISSVSGVPANAIAPGTTVRLTVLATDADSRSVTIQFTVHDAGGGTSAPTQVTIPVSDPLDAVGSIVSGGGTLTKTGAMTFDYVAA